MHNPRLIKKQNHWYLVDDTITPTEYGVSIWCNLLPVFTNFIDEENEICSISSKFHGVKTSDFYYLKSVVGSTNEFDGTPMLDESKLKELGVVDEIEYFADYTTTFANGKKEPYLIQNFVNILKVTK